MTDYYDAPPAPEQEKPPSKKWLYGPFIIFALLCAAYTAYWFFAKGKIDEGVDKFIAEQRAAGNELTFASKSLGGFPFRFALTVNDLKFANPNDGFDWRGEKFEINMLPWNFNHAILRSSGRNELALPGNQNYTAIIGPKSALSLNWNGDGIQEGGLTLDKADIISGLGDFAVDNLRVGLNNSAAGSVGKRISIDWDGVTIAEELIAGTDAEVFGGTLQASRLRLEGQGFGIFGQAGERSFEIAQLLLNWGPMKLGTKGKFRINKSGFPDGTLHIRLDDSDEFLELLRENGLMTSDRQLILGSLSIVSKRGEFYSVPIRNGAVSYPGLTAQAVPQLAPALGDAAPAE